MGLGGRMMRGGGGSSETADDPHSPLRLFAYCLFLADGAELEAAQAGVQASG
jgi:hypothetical protein